MSLPSDKNKADLEPFCPVCDKSLEMKHDLMTYYAEHFPTLQIRCLGCRNLLTVSGISWRERKPK